MRGRPGKKGANRLAAEEMAEIGGRKCRGGEGLVEAMHVQSHVLGARACQPPLQFVAEQPRCALMALHVCRVAVEGAVGA